MLTLYRAEAIIVHRIIWSW